VRVLGNAASAYELGQTQISVGNGRTVRLADLGQVRDLYAEQRTRAAVDGREVSPSTSSARRACRTSPCSTTRRRS
jgi:multidrug efflux pump subunit AcrB